MKTLAFAQIFAFAIVGAVFLFLTWGLGFVLYPLIPGVRDLKDINDDRATLGMFGWIAIGLGAGFISYTRRKWRESKS